ncbi:L-type lectin-domain containing receptor kinase VIII.1 [Apostasia shenzhenica]|uniref:non-specific serine/threonine protein kinase n=1 Tax=Apostasia shenzhenica TaxID=1088818 RepID=A0A2I0B4F4_9ASPA|nr:L-type lectin-domain containing receptor kinase VIII.1 [Apostasia shenzhenica]
MQDGIGRHNQRNEPVKNLYLNNGIYKITVHGRIDTVDLSVLNHEAPWWAKGRPVQFRSILLPCSRTGRRLSVTPVHGSSHDSPLGLSRVRPALQPTAALWLLHFTNLRTQGILHSPIRFSTAIRISLARLLFLTSNGSPEQLIMRPQKDGRLRYWRCSITLTELVFTTLVVVQGAAAARFDFTTLTLGSLKLLGDAHLNNGSIHLSRDLPVPNSGAGRALFAEPVRLRHPATGAALAFSTFFAFSVTNLNPSSVGGGLAFLLTSDDRAVGDPGGFLGLVARSGGANSAVVGVEFDTVMDVEFEDINGNHVGLDLNTMVSAMVSDLDSAGIDLKSGNRINAWIDYAGGVLQAFISYSEVQPENPVLAFPVDLAQFVEDFMFVGFSGSTQGSTEIHSIEWWSFSSSSSSPASSESPPPMLPRPSSPASSTSLSKPPPATISPTVSIAEGPIDGSIKSHSSSSCHNNSLCRQGAAAVAGVATAGAFFIAACAVFGVWAFTRRAKSLNKFDPLAAAAEVVNTPREFSYRDLIAATRGFNSSKIIGNGAFGTVYKGIMPETGAMVAVKRCINAAGGGEFLSELTIIASLRHRHLVRLLGWCQEKGEILLVYDYMRHGSLDKALFEPSTPALPWRHRRKILVGVASALAYLHHECERQVIHRDVKSSNVMLDEDFHPRLGDFGLARQIDHDQSPDATVTAGTMGYLAPEYLLTGRASDKTDVFSFGALVLEVVSGRRPIDDSATSTAVQRRISLVEWVWGLHGEGRLMEAADGRMKGEFDEGEVIRVLLVGLGCSSPDPVDRPGMRSVVQMLSGEAPPPSVPTAKPSMSFSASHHLLLSLQDSVSDYNALGLNLSSSSSSSSSLRSTLRGGAGGVAIELPTAGGRLGLMNLTYSKGVKRPVMRKSV